MRSSFFVLAGLCASVSGQKAYGFNDAMYVRARAARAAEPRARFRR